MTNEERLMQVLAKLDKIGDDVNQLQPLKIIIPKIKKRLDDQDRELKEVK